MEYTLCTSSSEEEGQISSSSFPSHITVLQYCYYPHTSLFIGDNSLPRLSDYQDSTFTTRIKKRIKKDYLENVTIFKDKAFFDNKFKFVCKIGFVDCGVGCIDCGGEDETKKGCTEGEGKNETMKRCTVDMGIDETKKRCTEGEGKNETKKEINKEETTNIKKNKRTIRSSSTLSSFNTSIPNINLNTVNIINVNPNTSSIHTSSTYNTNKYNTNTYSPSTYNTNKYNTNTYSPPTLIKVDHDYKPITSFNLLKKGPDLYLDLFTSLIYTKNMTNLIILKDSILTKINKPNIFTHFKILKNSNIIFEDLYYKKMNSYEYLEMFYESIVSEYKSSECRWYKFRDGFILVYSSTCFVSCEGDELFREGCDGNGCICSVNRCICNISICSVNRCSVNRCCDSGSNISRCNGVSGNGLNGNGSGGLLNNSNTNKYNTITTHTKLKRYYNTIDSNKNYLSVIDKKHVKIVDVEFRNDIDLSFIEGILNLKLEMGDYAFNCGNVYKIEVDGESIMYEGIDYELVN